MQITQVADSRINELFELYKEIVLTDFPGWTKENKKRWIEKDYSEKFWEKIIVEEKMPVLVAEIDGKYVGYAAVEEIDYGVAYFSWMGVLEAHRGQGIAKELINQTVDICRNRDCHKIELETQLPELVPFYLKCGFEHEGTRHNSWQHLDNYLFGMEI